MNEGDIIVNSGGAFFVNDASVVCATVVNVAGQSQPAATEECHCAKDPASKATSSADSTITNAEQPLASIKIIGAEQVRGRHTYMVYKLSHPELGQVQYRRFSQFVELVNKLLASFGASGATRAHSHRELEEIRQRLIFEKRHAGPVSLQTSVVQRRCKLLQELVDLLCASFSRIDQVRTFLGLASSARDTTNDRALRAQCPQCGCQLRIPASANPEELFRCTACGNAFGVRPDLEADTDMTDPSRVREISCTSASCSSDAGSSTSLTVPSNCAPTSMASSAVSTMERELRLMRTKAERTTRELRAGIVGKIWGEGASAKILAGTSTPPSVVPIKSGGSLAAALFAQSAKETMGAEDLAAEFFGPGTPTRPDLTAASGHLSNASNPFG